MAAQLLAGSELLANVQRQLSSGAVRACAFILCGHVSTESFAARVPHTCYERGAVSTNATCCSAE